MFNWLQISGKQSNESLKYNELKLYDDKEYMKLCLTLGEKCDEINNEIIKSVNNSVFVGKNDEKFKDISNKETRRKIVNKFNSENNILNTAVSEGKNSLNKDNLCTIKEILSNIINLQEKDLTELFNLEISNLIEDDKYESRKYFTNKIEDMKKMNERIYYICDIICNKLILNIACMIGFMSKKENSLWAGIISLLIVVEIRNVQYSIIIKDKLDDKYNEKYIILSWINNNNHEFFELLMNYYQIIPITYKIGEVLRDISTLLNLTQSSEIVDKKINKTFHIPDSVKIISYEIIKNILYEDELLTKLIKLSGNNCFDISSDSITTLRCYLFISPEITNDYILKNIDLFFSNIFKYLIQSNEYVPQRYGLRLLNQLLSVKELSKVMTLFSGNSEYLKIFMDLISSNLETISFEAFHIFKLFIANPKKSSDILNILKSNKNKIIQLLQFQNSRIDEQFGSDKEVSLHYHCYILKQTQVIC
ncbi:hypothetical protein FG379_000913 [Cryptosporidium bovis]|uniref:uncharacterized protein n=1 Tax=Cryptosporidium bovis TaxID=310047 RepID=UPI00351AA891|nr:hypothetical protein FG379_000913 [Cryptosporidium bovis]